MWSLEEKKSRSYVCHWFGNFLKQYTACVCWSSWLWKMWARAAPCYIGVLCDDLMCSFQHLTHTYDTYMHEYIRRYPQCRDGAKRFFFPFSTFHSLGQLGWFSRYQCCKVQPKCYLVTLWLNGSFSECITDSQCGLSAVQLGMLAMIPCSLEITI